MVSLAFSGRSVGSRRPASSITGRVKQAVLSPPTKKAWVWASKPGNTAASRVGSSWLNKSPKQSPRAMRL